MKIHLGTNQSEERIVNGNYVYVEQAAGLVRIETVNDTAQQYSGEYNVLTQRAQIQNIAFKKIRITNLGAEGDIILRVGGGAFVPPQIDTVEVAKMPNVDVDTLPPVEVAPNQTIHVAVSQGLTAGVVDLPYEVAANAARKKLIIKSPEENINAIYINGFPLYPSEKQELETGAAMTITGQSGAKVAIIEV